MQCTSQYEFNKRLIIYKILLILFIALSFPLIAEPRTFKEIEIIKQYPEHITEQKQYAYDRVLEKWGVEEWQAFDYIIQKESSWSHTTEHYPTGFTTNGVKSSATGLGGFLDSTWENVGCVKTYNANVQIECAIRYVEQRYKTPREAMRFHIANNWY